jgi:hypothetical protein
VRVSSFSTGKKLEDFVPRSACGDEGGRLEEADKQNKGKAQSLTKDQSKDSQLVSGVGLIPVSVYYQGDLNPFSADAQHLLRYQQCSSD